jgi:hypothetical protein
MKPMMPRCPDCSRPVAACWRRCPWCRSLQHWPRGTAAAVLDAWLDSLRNFGGAFSLWVGGLAVMLHFEQPGKAAVLGTWAALLLVAHVLLPWAPLAWRATEVLWGVGAVLAVALFPDPPVQAAVLAATPLLVLALMVTWRKPLLARLAGEAPAQEDTRPPSRWGGCEVCGEREARVVAPMWCVSLGVVTSRWTGEFHRLCSTHALLRALPASLVTLLLGWWGIPWGLIWTPNVLYQNLIEGGVEVDSGHLAALKASDPLHGKWQNYVPPIALALGLLAVPMGTYILLLRLGLAR